MNRDQREAFEPLSRAVRALFHKMGAAVSLLHEGDGVTGGMRAVLESVIEGGPRSVPELARARPVSRQHIQTLVNELLAAGYVEYRENPAHRRSKLVAPTRDGAAAFTALRAREAAALTRLAVDIDAAEMERATQALTQLIARFQGPAWQGIVRDLDS
ncbi:MAG: helix-turn-helix domain-containing protein [Kiloniellales bacterium]